MSLSSAQCRAARALIGWSQNQLVEASGVAKSTVANFEIGSREPHSRTLRDLRAALEAAGIEFLDDGQASASGGAGVRLKAGSARSDG